MNDIESRDQIIADLSVRLMKAEATIEELNELVEHIEIESGAHDCAALEAEIERLKSELAISKMMAQAAANELANRRNT